MLRAFALYRDRGTLNMRRGITVTLTGLPSNDLPSATAAEQECALFKSVFASKCVVLASGFPSKTGSNGMAGHRLGMSLAFQESKSAPLFETAGRVQFRTVKKPIAIVIREASEPTVARIGVYLTIEQACKTYVEKSPGCSLLAGDLNFTYGQTRVSIDGFVLLGYVDPTDERP